MQSFLTRTFVIFLTTICASAAFIAPSFAQGGRIEVTEKVINSRVTGWEHDLTDRDPNLSHWHWEPIGATSRLRNVRRSGDPQTPSNVTVTQKYVKTPYVKPTHVALPVISHGGGVANVMSSSTGDVNGQLLKRAKNSSVADHAKAVYSYSNYATVASGNHAQTKVAGQVLRTACISQF